MKNLLFIFFVVTIFFACDKETFPQNVTVTIPYTTSAVNDSAYILVWKGSDPVNCPLLDNGTYETMSMTGVTKHKVAVTGNSLTLVFTPSGEYFKVGGVVFLGKISSLVAVKDTNYQLPTRPGKMVIGNIQMVY